MATPRRLHIIVRGGADIDSASLLFGQLARPYVVLTLGGGHRRKTGLSQTEGVNPVWGDELEVELPMRPHAPPPTLEVKVKTRVPYLPGRVVARGSLELADVMYGGGQHEVTVPLRSRSGQDAGHLHLGISIVKAGPPPIGSAAGTMLGEVAGGGPQTQRASAVPEETLPSAQATGVAVTPQAGGIAPGEVLDPSKPGYGVIL